jgi:hypothetical protein
MNGKAVTSGGTRTVTLQQNASNVAGSVKLANDALTLAFTVPGVGPTIKLAGGAAPAATLSVGTPPALPQIQLTPTGITLQCAGGATKITLDATGIKLEAGGGAAAVNLLTAGQLSATAPAIQITSQVAATAFTGPVTIG